jgi:hypothetical protein
MGIMKSKPVELSELVKECNLILMVEYLEPFVEEVAIKSNDPNMSPPPFKKEGCVFTVKTIVKNADKIELPKTIRVPKEEWRRSLSQHKEQHAGGPNKSFTVNEYKTEVSSMKKADILFLHHFQGGFELETKNSFESLEELEKITMLLKTK